MDPEFHGHQPHAYGRHEICPASGVPLHEHGNSPPVYRASYPPVFGFRVACGASQPMAASGSESVVGR